MMANEKRLIDANACLKDLCDTCKSLYGGKCQAAPPYECTIRETLSKQPTVDAVEVVHGRWKSRPIYKINGEGRGIKYCDFHYCSECGTGRPIVPPYNYCPNCGAKMDGDENG